jgi:hypothetical protein
VEIAREQAATCASLYVAPLIPADKEERARRVHALHLPPSEPVLALYDATLFGSAENGFLLTPERICWKNVLEHPRQVAWAELDGARVAAREDRVEIAGGFVRVADAAAPVAARVVVAFAAFAAAHRGAAGSPYRRLGDAAPDGVGRLVRLARTHVGEIASMHYDPAIPAAKLRNARVVHAASLGVEERVAVLYDDTLFETGQEGFLLTPRTLCWKNLVGPPESRPWPTLRREDVQLGGASGTVLHVSGVALSISIGAELVARVAALLWSVIGEAAHGRRSPIDP